MGQIYKSVGGTSGRLASRQNPEVGGMGRMRPGTPKLPKRKESKGSEKGLGGLDFDGASELGKNLKGIFGGKSG